MTAFDADVLIYAAVRDHPLGTEVRKLLEDPALQGQRVGSVLLLPELLSKPLRQGDATQVTLLRSYLQRLALLPTDRMVGVLAAQLGAAYKLRAARCILRAPCRQGRSALSPTTVKTSCEIRCSSCGSFIPKS